MNELIKTLLDGYFIWILGCMAAGMITCFVWGYVLGMSQVEIEEEESHRTGADPLDRCNWN